MGGFGLSGGPMSVKACGGRVGVYTVNGYALAFLALLAVLSPPVAAGQDEPGGPRPSFRRPELDKLADEYVDDYEQRLESQAETDFFKDEADRLDTDRLAGTLVNSAFGNLDALDGRMQQAVVSVLKHNEGPVTQALSQAADEFDHETESLVNEWRDTRRTLNGQRVGLFETKAGSRIAGHLASLLSIDNFWFWLWGLLAVVSLMLVVAHDRRHEIRRWLNGGRPRKMGLSYVLPVVFLVFAGVTVGLFLFKNRIYWYLVTLGSGEASSPYEVIREQNRSVEDELSGWEAKRQRPFQEYTKALEDSRQRIRQSTGAQTDLPEQWATRQVSLQRVSVALDVQQGVVKQLESDLSDATKLQKEIDALSEERASYLRMQRWIRVILGVTLLGLAALGWWLFLRGRSRRRATTRNTCPLCLAENTFQPAEDDLNLVQCSALTSEDTGVRCNFVFASHYREMTKISFPTLGIVASGKTLWVLMAYQQLVNHRFPREIEISQARTPIFKDLEEQVDELLMERIVPPPTPPGHIPHPVIFNFRDRDRLGRSRILVNIFDYSGEVGEMNLADRQRQRALAGDGFLFFLDPTMPSDIQSRALEKFRLDLQDFLEAKGAESGRQIRTPVALCVSKLDLMVNMPYSDYVDPSTDGGEKRAERRSLNRFYRRLKEIEWKSDLASIEKRSQEMAALREVIWPNWDIEHHVDQLFGGRFKYFPLTPVGLNRLGETELTRIDDMAPVGLLDPLLWLLHMNGYPVFS